jgi:hypothetical protein
MRRPVRIFPQPLVCFTSAHEPAAGGHCCAGVGGETRRPPFNAANYHWLGFDLDHTLIAYSASCTRHIFDAAVTHMLTDMGNPIRKVL